VVARGLDTIFPLRRVLYIADSFSVRASSVTYVLY